MTLYCKYIGQLFVYGAICVVLVALMTYITIVNEIVPVFLHKCICLSTDIIMPIIMHRSARQNYIKISETPRHFQKDTVHEKCAYRNHCCCSTSTCGDFDLCLVIH